MLAHLGENRASLDLMNANDHVTSELQLLTPDGGGTGRRYKSLTVSPTHS